MKSEKKAYKRIRCSCNTFYGLPIFVNDEFGEIPFDGTERVSIKPLLNFEFFFKYLAKILNLLNEGSALLHFKVFPEWMSFVPIDINFGKHVKLYIVSGCKLLDLSIGTLK